MSVMSSKDVKRIYDIRREMLVIISLLVLVGVFLITFGCEEADQSGQVRP